MTDTFECTIPHPFAVVLNVLGKPLDALIVNPFLYARMRGFLVLKLWRDFGRSLSDHDGDWVEVRPVGWQAQPMRFQKD